MIPSQVYYRVEENQGHNSSESVDVQGTSIADAQAKQENLEQSATLVGDDVGIRKIGDLEANKGNEV